MMQPAARLVIHLRGEASQTHVLDDASRHHLGRDPGVDISIPHPSVSRRHAALERRDGLWHLLDLGSKNGTRIDGRPVRETPLDAPTWFSVGDVFCEFQPLNATALTRIRESVTTRRHSSAAWHARVNVRRGINALLSDVLEGAIDIAQCRRGVLLIGIKSDSLDVAAAFSPPGEAAAAAPEWSRTAVERALRERRPVYLSSQSDRAWLKNAASVVGQGLRSLACLPLLCSGRLLGVLYVDTDESTKVFDQLDVELLDAFAERAASALALADIEHALRVIEADALNVAPLPKGMQT